ncbi:hypothetical protein P279_28595 [Rhodobacteraceae bacterium PD-2]|nr:hypothetical protein P279_28595 [Rhodobacteraceae bacterium PD-2]
MGAVAPGGTVAACKWVSVVLGERATVSGAILLNCYSCGKTIAVLNAAAITEMRTAAMSALAMSFLARPESRSVGFVGVGAQAAAHLLHIQSALPGLTEIVCVGRSTDSARRFAEFATKSGVRARPADGPEEAIGCDIIVSTVPHDTSKPPFLDADLVRPGATVCAVDLGRPWIGSTMDRFDAVYTDDLSQAATPENAVKMRYQGPYLGDLSDLASGHLPGRTGNERILFQFPGFALGDAILSDLVFRNARAHKIGQRVRF